MPYFNMENGIIKKDWPDEYIFVDGNIGKTEKKSRQSSD
jgi:hypothetical protein